MKNVAHKKKWQSFEIVFGIPFFSAIILQFIYPLSFSFKQLYEIFIFGGVVLIILGLAFIILAHRELSKYSQPTDPGYPTNKLVTTGVFSISRNPLYLGGVCVVFGIGLSLNIGWILILLLPRSEEHTSELQSRGHLVCRLLLEKKNVVIKNVIMSIKMIFCF